MRSAEAISKNDTRAYCRHLHYRDYDIPGNIYSLANFSSNNKRIQHEIRKWLVDAWKNCEALCITITFEDSSHFSRHEAEKYLRIFHKKISYAVFKRAARRYKKRLGFVVVWEGILSDHPHCHCILEMPKKHSDFIEITTENIKNIQFFGFYKVKVCKNNSGWIDYITKLRSKGDIGQDIDVIHLPSNYLK